MRKQSMLAAAVLPLGLLSAGALAGQARTTGTIQGQVVDSLTETPVSGVLVRFDTGAEVLSDDRGRFSLAGIEAGLHMIGVLSSDCRVTWTEVEVPSGDAADVTVLMAAEAETQAERAAEEADRRRSLGKFITADEIDRMNVRNVAEILRRVAPNMVGTGGQVGQAVRIRARERSLSDSTNAPVVVINGVRQANASTGLDLLRPSDIATLEILPGAAAGWEYGSAGSAGVIRITTRRGDPGTPAEALPQACTAPGGLPR